MQLVGYSGKDAAFDLCIINVFSPWNGCAHVRGCIIVRDSGCVFVRMAHCEGLGTRLHLFLRTAVALVVSSHNS